MQTPERRKYRRLNAYSGRSCVVQDRGQTARCVVMDQSIGGYRIGGINPMHLETGQPLTVVRPDDIVHTRCVNVERLENGRFTIGLQRMDTVGSFDRSGSWIEGTQRSKSKTAGHLINPFVRLLHPGRVLCSLLEIDEEKREAHASVAGTTYIVSLDEIQPMTRQERAEELAAFHSLEWLTAAYVANGVHLPPELEPLLQYEFGAATF